MIYTLLFAIGIILITSKARNSDINVDCVLFGDINTIPLLETTFGIPEPLFNLIIIGIINLLIITIGIKGFKITSFDSTYAKTLGISIPFWTYLLLGLSSITTVYSFDSVGAIMVIGFIVIHASFANIITRRIPEFLAIALTFGVISSIIGHLMTVYIEIPTVPSIGVLMALESVSYTHLTLPTKRIL